VFKCPVLESLMNLWRNEFSYIDVLSYCKLFKVTRNCSYSYSSYDVYPWSAIATVLVISICIVWPINSILATLKYSFIKKERKKGSAWNFLTLRLVYARLSHRSTSSPKRRMSLHMCLHDVQFSTIHICV
jgi:hypothetical protein